MEKIQIIKKKRPVTLITAIKRRNLLEKEILSPYSAEEEGNQNITKY